MSVYIDILEYKYRASPLQSKRQKVEVLLADLNSDSNESATAQWEIRKDTATDFLVLHFVNNNERVERGQPRHGQFSVCVP